MPYVAVDPLGFSLVKAGARLRPVVGEGNVSKNKTLGKRGEGILTVWCRNANLVMPNIRDRENRYIIEIQNYLQFQFDIANQCR